MQKVAKKLYLISHLHEGEMKAQRQNFLPDLEHIEGKVE